MGKSLLVVESPTKVKTLGKYLGRNFVVKASVGHIKDLPKSKLGVDVEDNFKPVYEVIKGKQKIINEIREAAVGVDTIYLAPDPDREGEAIAWHLAHELTATRSKKKTKAKIFRVLIEEITKSGVERALASPTEINLPRFESQQARRILDRLVGYQISPILWEKVQRGLSAGRVQSVALRIICDREKEVKIFVPVEYWSIEARARGKNPPPFMVRLEKKNGEKIEMGNQGEAENALEALKKNDFIVADIQKKQRKRTPPPAFTTSKLQQEGARKFGYTAKRTMMLAQQLYEGIELGAEGAVGLITYMRTDSTRLSAEAVEAAQAYIRETYGADLLPETPRLYKSRKSVQDAHEAIRPTSLIFPPDKVKEFLKKDQYNLYRLIWDRFLACQMKDAIYDQTSIDVKAGEYGLKATGSILTYEGFMKIYVEGRDEAEVGDEEGSTLPELTIGEKLKVEEIAPNQHFTKPPPRFTEASLIKELEERGIGRPSTYASIVSTLQGRRYAVKVQTHFEPTELGVMVCDLLVEHFPEILNVEFTALMELKLDQIEDGKQDWHAILKEFYEPFAKSLAKAKKKMRDVKREETPTEHVCEKCSKPMIIKWGRHGHFLACSGYPECRNTKEFKKSDDGKVEIQKQETTDEICDKCAAPMVIKNGRFGKFLACSKYPDCKTTRSMSTGVPCPEAGCGGKILERRSRKGRTFFGCSKYPNCKHASWDRPVATPCPQCQAPYLVEKFTKQDGARVKCPKKECGYVQSSAA